jgi:hypothetical protein
VVHELIGITSLALHKGTTITYTNEGTQWQEQFTRVAFGAPLGNKPKNPSQSMSGVAMNNHQLVPILLRCSKPSRRRQPPRVTRKLQQEWSPSATRCNHSSKCTLDHSQLTWMQNQARDWVGEVWLSSQGCINDQNVQEGEIEPANIYL